MKDGVRLWLRWVLSCRSVLRRSTPPSNDSSCRSSCRAMRIEIVPSSKPRRSSSCTGSSTRFRPRRGEVTRGVPTSYAAPPLNKEIELGSELPPVWPFPEGQHRGVSLEPLYKTAPAAALRDPIFYEMLALIDALREGRARERKLAEKELIERVRRQLHERPESPPAGSGR